LISQGFSTTPSSSFTRIISPRQHNAGQRNARQYGQISRTNWEFTLVRKSSRFLQKMQKPDPTVSRWVWNFEDALRFSDSEIYVNHIGHMPVSAIHQHDMRSDNFIDKVRRGRRQFSYQISRQWVHAPTPTCVQHESYLQTRLPIRRQTIFHAEPDQRMIVMSSPPRVYNLVLVVVECRMIFVPMMFMLLCKCRAADEHQKHDGENPC
jgi:hypothetical protein